MMIAIIMPNFLLEDKGNAQHSSREWLMLE
jgi:hypothetical protein